MKKYNSSPEHNIIEILRKIILYLYTPLSRIIHEIWALLMPESYAKYWYKKATGKKLDLENPKDFNEKIQWLKIYSDTSQWTDLADKYKVRNYVEQCGLGHILVSLYGVWEKADGIDFHELPDKFVLKTNNSCGRIIIVKDLSKLDVSETRRLLNRWVKERYGLVSFQPHYWKIDRRIIAEELLEDETVSTFSSSIIDYKFWCIHGEPDIIMVLYDRKFEMSDSEEDTDSHLMRACVYDLNWNLRTDIINGPLAADSPLVLPKPKCFDEMLEICRRLSKPFPQVRVDLYEINSKVYFGELTFTPGGNMDYFTPEYFMKMGEKLDLTCVKRRKK